MQLRKLSDLFIWLNKSQKKRIICVNGVDGMTLEALSYISNLSLADITIVGDETQLLDTCKRRSIDYSMFEIIPCSDVVEAASKSVELIKNGYGDLICKGLISTDVFLRAILNKRTGLRTEDAFVSHVAIIEHASYHKLLMISDAAITPAPSLQAKGFILANLIMALKKTGVKKPKIALIAATEKILPKVSACTDAHYIVNHVEEFPLSSALVEGPMALDCAIDKKSADTKGLTGKVIGDADGLLFPNIESGNVFYKTCTKFLGCKTAGTVIGTKVPVILTSRGDSFETKINSIAFGLLMTN